MSVLIDINGNRIGSFSSQFMSKYVIYDDRIFVLDVNESTVVNIYREQMHIYLSSLDP